MEKYNIKYVIHEVGYHLHVSIVNYQSLEAHDSDLQEDRYKMDRNHLQLNSHVHVECYVAMLQFIEKSCTSSHKSQWGQ